MSSVTPALLGLIFVASFFQPSRERTCAAVVTATLTLCHFTGCLNTTGLGYYAGAAMVDLAIIAALSSIDNAPKMVIRIQVICVVSILCNFCGWALWRAYVSPVWYNTAYVFIYLWLLITLLRRGKADDVGSDRSGSGSPGVLRCAYACRLLDTRNGGQV